MYHRTRILDRDVDRIVVPESRRQALYDLAHGQVGCHFSVHKTKQRIGLNFMCPNLVRDVVYSCKCCELCQKRARITYRDCVPIEVGVVSMEPVFSFFYVDCMGPLFNSKAQYNCAIVFLDKTCRFPHAVPLSNLTAKHCCEDMLSLWQFTDVPSRVGMDNANNFTGELTREFMRRIGCAPIFCTPCHPEANSIERTIDTLKSLISKVAQEYPRS